MTRKLSQETLKACENDEWYTKSALSGQSPVQWHHVFTYARKQIDEPWNIVPLTADEHDMVTPHKHGYIKHLDEMVQLIALERATEEQLRRYSKVVDLVALRDRLREEYA